MDDTQLSTEEFDRIHLPKEWSDAINALQGVTRVGLGWEYTGKHDVKPLAHMLKSGEPVPQYVAKIISIHLAPPKSRWCGKLRYESPPPRAIDFWKNKNRERRAKIDLDKLRSQAIPFKEAVHQIAKKYRRSESWVANLPAVDDDRVIAETGRRLDPITFLP